MITPYSRELSSVFENDHISGRKAKYCLKADLRSRAGRRTQLGKILLSTLVPILLLFAETIYRLVISTAEVNRIKGAQEQILNSLDTGMYIFINI